ncbi:hypothetical protein BKA56DRAFT_686353 [Ilyonectria sp. MPI-CAGE-AT-0026]|nr:hypothetical protein BKA56DRAFT_686353 [Ilyonectria sp. MPI-CAGE-AT-0026]
MDFYSKATAYLRYWIGCIKFGKSYVYSAPEASGPWAMASIIDACSYDCGLHIDDDDKMYVVYGINYIMIAELESMGFPKGLPGRSLLLPMELAILKEIASIRRMIPTTYSVARWTGTHRFKGNDSGLRGNATITRMRRDLALMMASRSSP